MYTIHQILISLKEYLDCMLDIEMLKDIHVVLDSVKKDKETAEGDLVITLLRIEEETSRKPQNIYFKKAEGVEYPTSPDLDINLEVLISAPTEKYETSLVLISKVISILNSIKTAGKPADLSDESYEVVYAMNITLMNTSFDQMLSMWQTLGGTLVPAVAYKVRMVTVPGVNKADTARIVGKGKIRVEMGEMDTRGQAPKSLSVKERKQKKSRKKESGESKISIQIREK